MNLHRRHFAAAVRNYRCWLFITMEATLAGLTLVSYPITSPSALTTLFIASFASVVCLWVFAVDNERDEFLAEAARRSAEQEKELHDKFVVPLQELIEHTNGTHPARKAV